MSADHRSKETLSDDRVQSSTAADDSRTARSATPNPGRAAEMSTCRSWGL